MHAWQTRLPSLIVLSLLFVADLVCSLLIALSVHEWSWSGFTGAWTHGGLTRFSSDALDGVLLAVVRLIVLLALGWAAVRWGTPQFELQMDARKRAVKAREEARKAYAKKRGIPIDELGGDEEQRAGVVPTPVAAATPADSLRQPLLNVQEQQSHVVTSESLHQSMSWSPTAASPRSGDSECAIFERSLPPLPPAPALTDSEKLVFSRLATTRRNLLVAALFLVATCMQVYAGVKMVGFRFRSEWTEGLLMAAVIVSINAQQSVIRHIIDHLTKEEGYLFIKLHPHRIYYDESAVGHW